MKSAVQNHWEIPLTDAGDGSGDALLLLPPEMLILMGWDEGDTLSVESIDNTLQISKVK